MKRMKYIILALVLLLCSCGQSGTIVEEDDTTAWQKQYDLGVRYLSEGNYEEAVIAFTAAIEIDPKQAPAYVGRGDAYIGSGETVENLAAAQADYEKAIELDETNANAYLGLADVYIRRGDSEKARQILKDALERLGSSGEIESKLAEIRTYNEYGAVTFTERDDYRDSELLTEQELSWLETALEAAGSFDEPTLKQLAFQCAESIGDQGFFTLRTIWNGYKVELYSESSEIYNYNNTTYSFGPYLYGEFRPENGIGYAFSVSTPGEPAGVEGSNYGTDTMLASCQCVDWQWNGMATIVDIDINMERGKVEISPRYNGTVPMVNSLRNGDYVQNYTDHTLIMTYSNGMDITDYNGKGMVYTGDAGELDNTFWSVIDGYTGPLENILDDLYW